MTEKQFYKLDEFKGHLPNPRKFPMRGADITTFGDYPDALCDNFIVDLEVDKDDKFRLEGKPVRQVAKHILDSIITDAKKMTILLSEPQYIYDSINRAYVLFSPDSMKIGIQVKYYRYFRNRYPDCKFYTNNNVMAMKAIKVGRKLVGLVMPVMLPKMEEQYEEGTA